MILDARNVRKAELEAPAKDLKKQQEQSASQMRAAKSKYSLCHEENWTL